MYIYICIYVCVHIGMLSLPQTLGGKLCGCAHAMHATCMHVQYIPRVCACMRDIYIICMHTCVTYTLCVCG